MHESRRDGILLVCAANVCRSPLAELAIRARFEHRPGLELVPVDSAGVRVADPRPICPDVARFESDELWRRLAAEHRARPLDPDAVRGAALVVAASREFRAAVVSAVPEQRGVVFTLLEAVWLGRGYVAEAGVAGSAAVTAFQRHIDGMRGLRQLPTQPRRMRWRRHRPDPLDIEDGHVRRAGAHQQTMRTVAAAAQELADLIAGPRHTHR